MPPAGQDRFYRGWGPRLSHLVTPGGLSGEVLDLRKDVELAFRNVAVESSSSADSATSFVSDLQAEISRAEDDVRQATISAVDSLSNEVAAALVEAATEAAGHAETVESVLRSKIAQSEDDSRAAALSAVDGLAVQTAMDLAAIADEAAGYADVSSTLMREEVARSADNVRAAAYSAVDLLANEVGAGFVEASAEAAGVGATVESVLRAKIAQSEDDLKSATLSAVDALSVETAAGFVEASTEAAGIAATVETGLRAEIEQSSDDQGDLLASEVGVLNERIGKIFPKVQTTDGAATDLVPAIAIPFLRSVLLEVRILAQRPDLLERALYTIEALCRAVPSVGLLTVAGTPVDGDLVTIDGQPYTWMAAITPGTPFQVASGGSAAQAIINLVKAINLTGVDDTDYGAGTTKHPTVSGFVASASTMEAVALVPGAAGDTITTTDTEAGVLLSWGGGTLASGSDMTVTKVLDREDVDDSGAWSLDLVAGTGSTVEVKGTGEAGKLVDWLPVVRMTEI